MKSRKLTDILKFLNLLVLLILINTISSRHFFRWDLTGEKRFSISKATKDILGQLSDEVLVEVYLDGDLPPGFERMKRAIQETLDEFKVYSNGKLKFKFIDPYQASNAQSREKYFQSIAQKGIQPTDVFDTKNGNRIQKRILPGAVVYYGLGQRGVMLLKGNKAAPAEVKLNQSIEGIEYELASAIKTLVDDTPPTVTFLTGNGELDSLDIISLKSALSERYRVHTLDISTTDQISGTQVIVVAKPTKALSEADKFKIDQYLMKGGKALFMIDRLKVNMDSLVTGTFAFDRNLDITDLFFRYGVRLNPDFVQDIVSGGLPVVVGNMGDQPQVQVLPWPFYPILNNFSNHPITRNLNAVLGRFVGSIDTVKAENVTKTLLLSTSAYSRKLGSPVRVSVNEMKEELKPDQMKSHNIPVGYLLEGRFTSLFKNRFVPEGIDKSVSITPESKPTRMIVLSDGDFCRNEINKTTGRAYELGFDPDTNQTFGNLDFLLNSIDYLIDGKGLITARSKEVKIRLLDTVKVKDQRTTWQIINLILPLILLSLYGIIRFYLRKRKYSNFG